MLGLERVVNQSDIHIHRRQPFTKLIDKTYMYHSGTAGRLPRHMHPSMGRMAAYMLGASASPKGACAFP